MTQHEIYQLMNENPAFHLATVEGDQPRVRGMLLFRADENGILFHTASTKDVYEQLLKNPKAELCFQGGGTQLRVSGSLELVEDDALREEIFNHPSRVFLKAWRENGIDGMLRIFRLTHGNVVEWTMEKNFAQKEIISL